MFCGRNSPKLEAQVRGILARICSVFDELAKAGRPVPSAVVLGGGYGRGEGGAYTAADGTERLYNDLDLFVFTPPGMCAADSGALRTELACVERELSAEYHVEVEFGPLTPESDLSALAPTLMYQELKRGFVPVWGKVENTMAKLPLLDFSRIPKEEAMRLLLNRGTGLLLARRKQNEADLDEDGYDFIGRNISKAALAVGDAYLLLNGEYVYGAKKRLENVSHAAGFSASALPLVRWALDFKFAPDSEKCRTAFSQWEGVCREWAMLAQNLSRWCAPGPTGGLTRVCKNILLNLRYFRCGGFRGLVCHPRWHLMEVLMALLLDKTLPKWYINYLRKSGEFSGTPNDSSLEVFLRLWRRFN